jgi:hypothetical protein
MFVWRNAIILGLIFIVVGAIYWYVQGDTTTVDKAGATSLLFLGVAMMFTFAVLLRGSREL